MLDSVELGEKLGGAVRLGTSLEGALREYEVDMVPRSTASVLASRNVVLSM